MRTPRSRIRQLCKTGGGLAGREACKPFLGRPRSELATYMVRHDSKLALDTMAREELGFDPEELGGSAWIAAGSGGE